MMMHFLLFFRRGYGCCGHVEVGEVEKEGGGKGHKHEEANSVARLIATREGTHEAVDEGGGEIAQQVVGEVRH